MNFIGFLTIRQVQEIMNMQEEQKQNKIKQKTVIIETSEKECHNFNQKKGVHTKVMRA